jgi:hypothetical protein
VRPVEESRQRLGTRAVTAIVLVVIAAALFWAASPLAAGGSDESGVRDSPAATTVGAGSDTQDDCPNRDRDSASSAGI